MLWVVFITCVVRMAFDKKSLLLLTVLGLVSACLTLYTVRAYAVARYAYADESGGGWLYTPSGSFFPWPREPGMATALSKMSESDLFIYRYLIKSWVLVGVTVLLWAITCLYFSRRIMRVHT